MSSSFTVNKQGICALFACFLFVFCTLFAAEEEIRVALPTQSARTALYLAQFDAKDASYSTQYLGKLHEVLAFDLNYSGYANVSVHNFTWEKELAMTPLKEIFALEKWKKTGLSHVLKGVVKKDQLDLYAFSVASGSLMHFEKIVLTGEHAKDRQQIHKLSNALIKSFYGGKGIATTRILYAKQVENSEGGIKSWKSEIWECDWDGHNARQVTYEQNYSITPAFIPGDSGQGMGRFLYVNYKNGQPKIYASSLGQRTGRPLISLRGNQLLPAISPQRDQMAFICDAAGRPDLFLQRLDPLGEPLGKPQQLFSYPRATQASPSFSPDGLRLAFVSDKGGSPRIYVIAVHGAIQQRPVPLLITKQCRENTCPSWSPDGTKLAYSAKTNGERQIWIYDFTTQEERQLTTGPGNKENPTWAPDSLHLVFNSTDPDASELYLINLHQPDAVKITKGPGKKHYPTWGMR